MLTFAALVFFVLAATAAAVALQNFNREFDNVIEAQKRYCVPDAQNARVIRARVKKLVLAPYVEFTSKNSHESYDFNLDTHLKYDAESIEIIINRLFDASL